MRRLSSITAEISWFAVALAIVAGGIGGFLYLGANREVVAAAPVETDTPIVAAEPLTAFTGAIPIKGEGFIQAARRLSVASQVGGRIVALHPAIEARGMFDEGDVLMRIDDRSARASLAQIEASIESSEAKLNLTRTQLERAQTLRERDIIAQDRLDELLAQESELAATTRGLIANRDVAIVALDQTVVRAPFSGRVLEKHADLGAVISVGAPVADIYADDALEVEIAVREDEAALIPDLFSDPNASATIVTDFAGQTVTWDAAIDRVDRQIDQETRTIDITLKILDPSSGRMSEDSGPVPALINAFVQVRIDGVARSDLFVADITHIRNKDSVWLLRDGVLRVHPVGVLHRDGTTAYFVADGIDADSQIITSALAAGTEGMAVRQAALSEAFGLRRGD